MISFEEIQAESVKQGIPIETIEKDYHLDWYLAALWQAALFQDYLFYGGTAIKKLYVPNHRFSEDIDLISERKFLPEEIAKRLARAHQFLEQEANLFCFFRPEEIKVAGTQTRFLIHYRGFPETGGSKRFLLDIAQGIEGLPKPVSKKLITSYRDLEERKILIPALPLEVICADKLELVVDRKRKEPRDIYDLWSVLMQAGKFDRELFLVRLRKRLSYFPEFGVVTSSLKDPVFQNSWEIRLKHQVPGLPSFHVVTLELAEKLEAIWRSTKGVHPTSSSCHSEAKPKNL